MPLNNTSPPSEYIEYMHSAGSEVHVINAKAEGATLEAGILCVFAFAQATIRISNEQHSFLIELPEEVRCRGEKLKAFNVQLAILDYEPL